MLAFRTSQPSTKYIPFITANHTSYLNTYFTTLSSTHQPANIQTYVTAYCGPHSTAFIVSISLSICTAIISTNYSSFHTTNILA